MTFARYDPPSWKINYPKDRKDRNTSYSEDLSLDQDRLWHLASDPIYGDIRTYMGKYVHETIPSPFVSQERWVLAALPDARLFHLSVGGISATWAEVTEVGGRDELRIWMNVWDEDGAVEGIDALMDPDISYKRVPASPLSDGVPVLEIKCERFHASWALLGQDFFCDAAYRLNIHAMGQGKARNAADHNRAFATDVLLAAWQASHGYA